MPLPEYNTKTLVVLPLVSTVLRLSTVTFWARICRTLAFGSIVLAVAQAAGKRSIYNSNPSTRVLC